MKRILTVLLFSLTMLSGYSLTFSGKITNEAGEVMPYVSVYIQDMKTGDVSDLDGNYIVTDVEPGRHSIIVSHVGYGTQTLDVDFQQDETRDFILSEQAYTMSEIFVTPNGESIQLFILRQLVEKYQKLGKRVDHFTKSSLGYFEQRDNNISDYLDKDEMKLLYFALGLVGYKYFGQAIFENPNLKVETNLSCIFKGGSLSSWQGDITSCDPQLTDRQRTAWLKLEGKSEDNGYDYNYKEMAKLLKTIDKLKKKDPQSVDKQLTYAGAYDEGEHVVHVIKYGTSEYHIVDGCWQLRRIVNNKSDGGRTLDFCEIAKDLYMPVSQNRTFEWFTRSKASAREQSEKLQKEDTSTMSESERKRHDSELKRCIDFANTKTVCTIAYTFKYTDFVLKGASLLNVGSSNSRMVK